MQKAVLDSTALQNICSPLCRNWNQQHPSSLTNQFRYRPSSITNQFRYRPSSTPTCGAEGTARLAHYCTRTNGQHRNNKAELRLERKRLQHRKATSNVRASF